MVYRIYSEWKIKRLMAFLFACTNLTTNLLDFGLKYAIYNCFKMFLDFWKSSRDPPSLVATPTLGTTAIETEITCRRVKR